MERLQSFPCPTCKSSEVRRSHRKNNIERLFSFMVLPVRCQMCDGRFFRPRWMVPVEHATDTSDKSNSAHA